MLSSNIQIMAQLISSVLMGKKNVWANQGYNIDVYCVKGFLKKGTKPWN